MPTRLGLSHVPKLSRGRGGSSLHQIAYLALPRLTAPGSGGFGASLQFAAQTR